METIELTKEEIYYLGQYKNIETIVAIEKVKINGEVQLGLMEKGILDAKGKVCKETIYYVETIASYCHSEAFFVIQDYIFGIQANGLCIVMHHNTVTDSYAILISDVFKMLLLASEHPLIKNSILHYHSDTIKAWNITINEEQNTKNCHLFMAIFDTTGKIKQQIMVVHEEGEYFALDTKGNKKDKISQEDYFGWILQQFPIIEQYVQQVVMSEGGKKDE